MVELSTDRADALRIMTLVVNALGVLAVLGLIIYLTVYVRGQRATSECYQQAFTDLNSSLKVSREAAKQDRAQLRGLVESLATPTVTDDQRQQAFTQFVAASEVAEKDRAAAPLPTRDCSQ